MKTLFKAIAAATIAFMATGTQAATYSYVGSWHVGDGPQWSTNPQVYSGQEAAAVIFGGSASDYAISTVSSNVADINFKAFLDGYGDGTYLYTPAAQDFKLISAGYQSNGYNYPAFSAYILDHTCSYRYNNSSLSCAAIEPGLNYAFRVVASAGNAVPEPASVALFAIGLIGIVATRRKTRANKKASM